MGTAAPAGNQFPSEPPPNDTAMLTPLGQLQRRRRSPRSSTHHLLPLSTAKHPSQAGDGTLQMGCHDHLGLSLSPGSCGHGATGHARYQDYFCTYTCPLPHPFSHFSSPLWRVMVTLLPYTVSSLLRSLQDRGHAGQLSG